MIERSGRVGARETGSKLPRCALRASFVFAMIVLSVLCVGTVAKENTAEDWLKKGQELDRNGSHNESILAYNKALDLINETLKKDLNDSKAWHTKGLVLQGLYRINEAVDAFSKVIELDPRNAEAWLHKGKALDLAYILQDQERTNASADAIKAFDKAIEIDPNYGEAWTNKGYSLLSLAALNKNLSEYNESLKAFDKAVELIPTNDTWNLALAWDGRAITLTGMGNTLDDTGLQEEAKARREEAVNDYSKAIELGPSFAGLEAQLYRAGILADLGRYNESLAAYDDAIETKPANPPGNDPMYVAMLLTGKGDVLEKIGDHEGALNAFDKAIELFPEFAEAWKGKGDAFKALGRNSEADASFAKAKDFGALAVTAAQENTADDWYKKGVDLAGNGSYKDSLEAYEKASEIEPQNATLWDAKGTALMMVALTTNDMNSYNQSLKAHEKAIGLDPKNTTFKVNKGYTLRQMAYGLSGQKSIKFFEEALGTFDDILTMNPNSSEAWAGKGVIFDDMAMFGNDSGKYNNSLQAYDKAIELAPVNDTRKLALAQAYEGKAVVLSHLGTNLNSSGKVEDARARYEEAVKYYDMVIEIDSDFVAQEARQNRASILNELGRHEESAADYQKSLEKLNQSIQKNPKDTSAWVGKGLIFWAQGNYQTALLALNNATEIDPEYVLGWRIKGTLLSDELGEYNQSISAFDRALQIDPHASDAYLGKANALLALGKSKEALVAYDRALEIDSNLSLAWYGKGEALRAQGKYEDAIGAYERAIELNSRQPQYALIGKGMALDNLGRHEDALKAYNQSLDNYNQIVKSNPRNAEVQKYQGDALRGLGRYNESLQAYDTAIELNPKYIDAWKGKGDSLKALGRQSEANVANARARELGYSNSSPTQENTAEDWFNKGQELFRNGSKEEAVGAYDKAIELNPRYSMAWGGKASALSILGRYNESLDAFDRAIETWPANDTERISELWVFKGNTLLTAGRPKEAFKAYDEAIRIYPQNFDAWIWKADSLDNLAQYNDSLKAYDKAIDAAPSKMPEAGASARVAKADVLLKMGRYEEAYNVYNKTSDLNSSNHIGGFYSAWSWRGMGSALAGLGRYNESLEAFNKSMGMDPKSIFQAWSEEGNALRDMGKYEEAVEAYNKSIETALSEFASAKAWIGMGRTLDEMGKHDAAVKAYEAAINDLDKTLQQSPLDAETWYLKGIALKALGNTSEADYAFAEAKELGYNG
jgi:superkiller protein 3